MQMAGSILSAAGSIVGGIAAKKAGNRNRDALYAGALEQENTGNAVALRIRDQARKAIGQQAAAQWANGFTGEGGSALDALTESQVNATMDMMQVRRDAESKAIAMRQQGDNEAMQGNYAFAGAMIGAAAKLAGGYSDWASAKRPS